MAATILLVDCDLIDRADWQALLQYHGYKVIAAQNGRTALEKCPAIRPDLILIDLGLTDIPGYEVYRRIKNDPKCAGTPVLMMGPYSDRVRCMPGSEGGAASPDRIISRDEVFYRVQDILGGATGLLFENAPELCPVCGRGGESLHEHRE